MSTTDLLPDSRLLSNVGAVMREWPMPDGTKVWIETVPCFCANCGAEGPFVPKENTTFMFWLCRKCEHFGAIAGTMTMPDHVFFQKVADEMLESHGRYLDGLDLVVLAAAGSLGSGLEKLIKESPYLH
jgi:hypothetical protein